MSIVALLRWLRGYVVFTVTSGPGQRLLGACAARNIMLWNTSAKNGVLCASAGVADYRRMRAVARELGVITRVKQRGGARFLIHRYRRRVGVVVGIALFILFFALSQQFIWVIRVNGCQSLEAEALTSVLSELGVSAGTLKSSVDPKSIQRRMQLSVGDLAWCALNIRGTTATLEVRERVKPPQKIDTNLPANIVAGADGQITNIQVLDGQQLLKKGDTVLAGDLIVSGVRQDQWGLTHLIRANAIVLANVPLELTVEIPLEQTEYHFTGKLVRRSYLDVFGARVPLFLYSRLDGKYRVESRREDVSLFGMPCDVGLIKETYIFYDELHENVSPRQALIFAQNELERLERRSWNAGSIKRREVSAEQKNGGIVLTGRYIVEMDIARQIEIPVLERQKEQQKKPEREGGYDH